MEQIGERKTAKMLADAFKTNEGYDGLSMFLELKRREVLPEDTEKKVLHEGFTEYNHRLLIRLNNEFSPRRREIEYAKFAYSEDEKKLEKNINGYDFRLAEDSNQLLDISNEMNNCVGHVYQTKAKEHTSIIVYAAKDSYYKVCIELHPLDGKRFKLIQCLGYGNSRLEGELYETCKKWLKECGTIEYTGFQ